ncbi:MAG: hypothetical protein Q9160_004935 [Pyrenula sp. 1 TL-2023]
MDKTKTSKSEVRRNESNSERRQRDMDECFVDVDHEQGPNKELKQKGDRSYNNQNDAALSAESATSSRAKLNNDDNENYDNDNDGDVEEGDSHTPKDASSLTYEKEVEAIWQHSDGQDESTCAVGTPLRHHLSKCTDLLLGKPIQAAHDNGPVDEEIWSDNARVIELTNIMEDMRREDPESILILVMEGRIQLMKLLQVLNQRNEDISHTLREIEARFDWIAKAI